MIAILFATIAMALVLCCAQSLRMLRATLVEDLIATEDKAGSEGDVRTSPFTRLIDRLGRIANSILLGFYGQKNIRRLAWQLRAAGQPSTFTAKTFIQREAGFVILGILLMVIATLNGQWLFGVVICVLFAAWMHAWLILTIKARRSQIENALPDFLDVLSVTVAAGIPFRAALQRVAEQHSGPLAEEMLTTLREMQLGISRRESLENLRDRVNADSVSAFVTSLLQSEELGSPIEDSLRQIAAEVRREHAQQVRRQAAKAQPKVSLVVTTFIVPGAIVLIVGAMILDNMDAFIGFFNG